MDGADDTPESPRSRRELRASDQDRDAVADVLRQAAGEGRLTLDELEERLERAFQAKTYAELEPLVADLPAASWPSDHARGLPASFPQPPGRGEAGPDRPLVLRATLENQHRDGVWTVPRRLLAEPVFANVKLNFLQARCTHPVVDLEVRPGAGNVVLIVPPGWAVDTQELDKSWGSVRNRAPGQPEEGKPLILVHGSMGVSSFVARAPYFYENPGR